MLLLLFRIGLQEIFITDSQNNIVDYYAVKSKYEEFGKIEDAKVFGLSVFFTLHYLYDLHMNHHLFHGDIKPANIFVSVHDYEI